MKWAKLSRDADDDRASDEERRLFYKEYKDQDELDKDLEANFRLWAKFEFDKEDRFNKRAQRKYEIFCGGYLYYHEYEVEVGGKADRKIHFKWINGHGKIKDRVEIYISKTDPSFFRDPNAPPKQPPPEGGSF